MPYKYATEDRDYSDLASGRVLYNRPGAPAFPVRLVSEIFQRAAALIQPAGRLTLYDPVCGGAYHLAALGFLHGEKIRRVLASDVSDASLDFARRNLSLLTDNGLRRREREIEQMLADFGKPSHAEALRSTGVLRVMLSGDIDSRVFHANALDPAELRAGLDGETIDLVISDIPYGHLSSWEVPEHAHAPAQTALWQMLDALTAFLRPGGLVAVAADKQQKVAHPAYRRVEHFQIGKRQVFLLVSTENSAA